MTGNNAPPESTRLYRLTQSEADLIHDFRVLSESAQDATGFLVKSQAVFHVEPPDGNVVAIHGRSAN